MSDPSPPAPVVPQSEEKPRRPFKRRVLRWLGIGVAGLAGLLLLAATVLYVRGRFVVRSTHDVEGAITSVPTDPVSIARGEHVALIHGCQDCHGDRLEGKVFLDIPPGFIVAPNLTRGSGGVGSAYSAVDWDRAVRYGVRPNGRAILPFMPYPSFNRLNDADMAALAAFLASRPAVDNQVPQTKLSILGYIIFGVAGLSRDGLDAPRTIVTPGPTAEYGANLASHTCAECHGDRLQGSDDVPGLHGYAAMDASVLTRALRTGVAADGRQLKPNMPWRAFRHMDDVELTALYAHVRAVAAANP